MNQVEGQVGRIVELWTAGKPQAPLLDFTNLVIRNVSDLEDKAQVQAKRILNLDAQVERLTARNAELEQFLKTIADLPHQQYWQPDGAHCVERCAACAAAALLAKNK
jgi:hypothetical protein